MSVALAARALRVCGARGGAAAASAAHRPPRACAARRRRALAAAADGGKAAGGKKRGRGFGASSDPVQDALISGLSEVAQTSGRTPSTPTTVLGAATDDEAKWAELDAKVNEYPILRSFKAIGTGGDDFVAAMGAAAAGALGRDALAAEQLSARPSSGGKYIAVTVGPLRIESSEQLQAVYKAMQADGRMKYFL